jgi:asparagine synthase (glutamine-hydrolysing)
MCGIAGIYRPDGGPVQVARVRRMADAMRHRGPDDEGYVAIDTRGRAPAVPLAGPRTAPAGFGYPAPYAPAAGAADPADRALVLGHVRLAIIDLSPGGHQPLSTADGQVWVTFGGEIYNYIELRAELQARGHEFTTASDTEVLAHGWAEWGEALFERMNGMWNVALWDARRQHLVLARDRFGVKPLYTRFRQGELAFATELRGLLAAGGPAEPHLPAAKTLLAVGRVDTGRETFFAGIEALPPGHFAIAGERGLELVRYWDLRAAAQASPPVRAETAPEALQALVTDSVRLRLRSDVKVGTCLSGGIDSSTVVALSTRLLGRAVDAYSVAYDEGPAFDERPYMALLCRETGARHHLVVPKGEDLLAELEAVTLAQEEPAAGPGVYSQWQVMRLAGQDHAKVLLDGQGADELFGGYFAFYYPLRLRALCAAGAWGEAAALARAAVRRGHSPLEVLARAAEPWLPPGLFQRGRAWLGAGDWSDLLGSALAGVPITAGAELAPPVANATDPLTERQLADVDSLLLPSLLRYEDRNSMAFSIEARVPFLDYRVAELAFRLPPAAKLTSGRTKAIVRDAMRGIVPDVILARQDKRGFEAPVVRWLVQRHASWLSDLLIQGRAVERGFVTREGVVRLLARHRHEPRGPGHELWRLTSLELWLRAAFDRQGYAVTLARGESQG